MALSSFVLLASARPTPPTPQQGGSNLFSLAWPVNALAPSYKGVVLRPFGAVLLKATHRYPPIALKALPRRPRGHFRPKRPRPYASHLLRNEAPFVEQPVARAMVPYLGKLRPK